MAGSSIGRTADFESVGWRFEPSPASVQGPSVARPKIPGGQREDRLRASPLGQHGLSRRQTSDGNPVGRAADVVHSTAVEGANRGRVAAMLAAYTHLELGIRAAPALHPDAH